MTLTNLVNYTFTGNSTGTALDAVAAETGGPWVKVGNKSTSDVRTTSAGRIANFLGSSSDSIYVATGVASALDGDIYASFTALINTTHAALGLRVNATTYNGYLFGLDASASRWTIFKGVSIAAAAGVSITLGQTYVLRMSVRTVGGNAVVTGYVDGVQVCTYTDSSPLSAGKPAVYFYAGSTSDDTHGSHLDNVRVTDADLTSPTLVVANGNTSVSLSIGTAGTGGSGTYSTYDVYRSTTPNDSSTLLAAGVTLPYVDAALSPGVTYYYRLLVTDSHGNTVFSTLPLANVAAGPYATPGALVPAPPTWKASATLPATNLVAIGNSITAGVQTTTPSTDALPVVIGTLLAAQSGNAVSVRNQGVSGYSTTEWQPGTSTYNAAIKNNGTSAASVLNAANPTRPLVFTVMLGTNDSTSGGYANGNKTKAAYKSQLAAIVDGMLAEWPACYVFLHYPIYFSPNAVTAYTYDEASLLRVQQYQAAIDELVATYGVVRPGQVLAGDKLAYTYFAANYNTSGVIASEGGSNGTYKIHPTTIGSATLAAYQARAIFNALANTDVGAYIERTAGPLYLARVAAQQAAQGTQS